MRRQETSGPPPPVWRRRAGLALVAVALAACAATEGGDAAGVIVELPTDAAPEAATFAPAPERSFIWVGTTDADQLTGPQLAALAEGYDIVVLAKFHAHWDVAAHHEAARALVALRPEVRVFAYFSMKYWFDNNRWGEEIDPAWLLRDAGGRLVQRREGRDDTEDPGATYVDLANADYRAWALGVLASWLEQAPYAGIAFDAAAPLGGGDADSVAEWEERLGAEHLAAYDRGLRELLAAAKQLVGPTRTILYNGIAPNPGVRGDDRELGLLDLADAALDERFCVDVHGELHAVDEDLALLTGAPGGELLMRTTLPDDLAPAERARLERLCFGTFLLGWEPGRSYFQSGSDYTTAQLDRAAPDVVIALGRPDGSLVREGDLLQRRFEHGAVAVNLGPDPRQITVSEASTEVRGGRAIRHHEAGAVVTIAAADAVFLLRGSLPLDRA